MIAWYESTQAIKYSQPDNLQSLQLERERPPGEKRRFNDVDRLLITRL